MDMILARADGYEEAVIPYDVDIEVGEENTFEIGIPAEEWSGEYAVGKMAYITGTEFGGIIGGYRSQHDPEMIYAEGYTWRGLLSKKIISPKSGQDYYTISGDLNAAIGTLIADFCGGDLFQADSTAAGAEVSNYQFVRYTDLLTGMMAMCDTVGFRLSITYEDGAVTVGAVPAAIRSDAADLSGDEERTLVTSERIRNGINHLICLGQGELRDRTVVHIYTDAQGRVVSKQALTGRNEIVEVYENTGAETGAELRADGLKRLDEVKNRDIVTAISLQTEEDMQIGDIVEGIDHMTGIAVREPITSKIFKITGGIPEIEIRIGGQEIW